MKDSVEFEVNYKSRMDGKVYAGQFKAKTKLSMLETIKQDEYVRTVLGKDPNNAGETARGIAEAIGYCRAHITSYPKWWEDCTFGTAVEDQGILAAVSIACQQAIDKEYAELFKQAEEAEKTLLEQTT